MKKILKVIAIGLVSLVLFYGVFVGIDCLRLQNAFESKPPIITTQATQINAFSIKYMGVGYTVTYRLYEPVAAEDYDSSNSVYEVSGAEFRLFDKILLWAWIA